ncbi:MAG: carbohydrate kinase family protein [Anaerolineaceae bacterium]|nr:carbohydrate kinase family protein [Anaerolineaceae bacterium]
MAKILVSGLINIETTLRVDRFPVDYSPANYPFFGINSSVSGVGYNLAKALHTLGDEVEFLSLIGEDLAGRLVFAALAEDGIPDLHILPALDHTAQSVILYDPQGRRQIYTDLKDIQERSYPVETFDLALQECDLAALCNINFSRPFLSRAQRVGCLVATDVHALSTLEDDYNRDFMAAAAILFLSDERLPVQPEDFARQVVDRYQNDIVVIGLGARGALLAVRQDGFYGHFPAVRTRAVVNTIGAGDALFSCFLHEFVLTGDPYRSLKQAMIFASYKIGATGAADGFLCAADLQHWYNKIGQESG